MRISIFWVTVGLTIGAVFPGLGALVPWDFTGPLNAPDGLPDILWHRSLTSEVYVWEMNNATDGGANNPDYPPQDHPTILGYANHANTLPPASNSSWKIIGTGDFDGNGTLDILWQLQNATLGVWYMNGPSFQSAVTISGGSLPGRGWYAVGCGDFGQAPNGTPVPTPDTKPDIVWVNIVTGQKAIWLMDGVTFKASVMIDPGNAYSAWQIVAVADFGASPTSITPDNNPDLLLENETTGSLAVWYMSGYNPSATQPTPVVILDASTPQNPLPAFTLFPDLDNRVVAVGDWVRSDPMLDIMVREVVDGRITYLQLQANNNTLNYVKERSPVVASPSTPTIWDPDWRANRQVYWPGVFPYSTKLTRVNQPVLKATSSATGITLSAIFNIPAGHTYTYSYIRRLVGNNNSWTQLTTCSTATCFDGTAAPNTEFIYRVQAFDQGFGVPGIPETAALWSPSPTTIGTTLIHNRGKVLVIVEDSLMTQTGPSFVAFQQKVLDFQKDLAGDGWEVVIKTDAPRHVDTWGATDTAGVTTVKNWINSASTGAKAVILLGHVVIPYSGSYTPLPSLVCASDGHTDHATAWTADMYYGDVNATWSVWTSPASQAGQFAVDFAPSPIELAVGRIDFARLTAFGLSDPIPALAEAKEADLLVKYLTKDHNYRVNTLGSPFPLPQKGVSYISWGLGGSRDQLIWDSTLDCKRIITDLFGNWAANGGRLLVGEPLRNGSPYRSSTGPLPYLFAFAGGDGGNDQIYNQRSWDLRVRTDPELKNTTNGPGAAFWFLRGSYFSDFNLGPNINSGANPNNLPRSILATGDYSLVVIPASGGWSVPWNLAEMNWGRTIGDAFLTSLNDDFIQANRWRCILGDPTLRLSTVLPPTLTTAVVTSSTTAALTFSGGETTSYYIYRSANQYGPFNLITPVTGAQVAYSVPYNASAPWYMVRCGKLVNLSSIDYTSLSQGDIKQAQ